MVIQVYFILKKKIIPIDEILKSYIKYILCALPFFGITYGINHLLKYSLVINLQLLIRLFAILFCDYANYKRQDFIWYT